MSEILNLGNTIGGSVIGSADGPTAVFLAGQIGTGVLLVLVAIGAIYCLFGFKLYRILAAIFCFSLGAGVGVGISAFVGKSANLTGIAMAAIVIACGLGLALIAFFAKRFGAFVLIWSTASSAGTLLIDKASPWQWIVVAIVSLIMAVLAASCLDPAIMIETAIIGGICVGSSVGLVIDNKMIGYIACAVAAVIGMIVQFAMQSFKVKKKDKKKADAIKEKESMDYEIENAKNLLDDADFSDVEEVDDELEIFEEDLK